MNVYRIYLKNQLPDDNYIVIAENIRDAEEIFINLNSQIPKVSVTGVQLKFEDVDIDYAYLERSSKK